MNCFPKTPKLTCGYLGEKKLIGRITEIMRAAKLAEASPCGPGDDCAVLPAARLKKNLLITSDAVILGRHFSEKDSPYAAGEKLVKRNISDIASMGGCPQYAQASAIISKNLSSEWLTDFCKGMCAAAAEYKIKFTGGDLASVESGFFSMHLTLLGSCSEKYFTRGGAKDGDAIFVTGKLGGSLESGRHLGFTPRVKEAQFLLSFGGVTSCMDISDGLASDLKSIIPPSCRAVLENVPQTVLKGQPVGIKKALCDGEDYELVFTFCADTHALKKAYEKKFSAPLYEIGRMEKCTKKSAGKIFLKTASCVREFSGRGFEH